MACPIALRRDSGELSRPKRGSLHSKKRVFVSTATFTISITKTLSPAKSPVSMIHRFNANNLLNCAVSDDGEKTTFALSEGAPAPQITLTVSPDFLEHLMLALPMILLEVRERRKQVRDCRLPCALEKLDISLARDQTTRILTLTTPDEISVSFHVSEEQLAEIMQRSAALAEQVRRSLQ